MLIKIKLVSVIIFYLRMYRWWKKLDLESKIPNYFRVRAVECLFWATGIYMEPHYSVGRIILSKWIMLHTVLDDTCDAHCTLTEVIGLVESLERYIFIFYCSMGSVNYYI